MNLLSIIGTRPQIIKCFSINQEIKRNHKNIKHEILHTGQHFDYSMSENLFKVLNLKKPIKNLKISSLDHGAMTGKMIWKIENFLKKKKYDCILLYGDTNSTLAAAIACKKLKFKIAHIEAGIRSYNMNMPEEINRLLTDRISDFLFCPTKSSVINLKKEGIIKGVYFTGDVMLDSYLNWKKKNKRKFEKKHIFFTLHRPYNTDNKIRLKKILKIINLISKNNQTILSLHPRTKKNLKNFNLTKKYKKIIFIKSLDYHKTLELVANAKFVITDSGGIQKEAYFMKKPCLTIRSETEWPETLKFGNNRLIFNKLDDINKILKFIYFKNKKTSQKSIFGNGKSSNKIINILKRYI